MNPLQNSWVLYFHSFEEKSYSESSYIRLKKISFIEDFGSLFRELSPKILNKGMFFLMKSNILPIWEACENKNGGFYSFKGNIEDIQKAYTEICMATTGGWLTTNNTINQVNGVSLNPRKHCVIYKIWSKSNKNIITFYNKIPFLNGKCIFSAHGEKKAEKRYEKKSRTSLDIKLKNK